MKTFQIQGRPFHYVGEVAAPWQLWGEYTSREVKRAKADFYDVQTRANFDKSHNVRLVNTKDHPELAVRS